MKDLVRVLDRGFANLRTKAGSIIAGRAWDDTKSVVEVQGWVKLLMRERGKIVKGSHREGLEAEKWMAEASEYLKKGNLS